MRAGKFSQFEGVINIPMILTWEGRIPEGLQYHPQVSLMDVLPTAISAAGINDNMPIDADGVNLLDFIDQPAEKPHEFLFWRTDYNKAMRSDEWKLIWNTRDEQIFLYELRNSNFEEINVASEHPERIREMQKKYNEWEDQMQPPLWPGVMEFRFDVDGKETWWAI